MLWKYVSQYLRGLDYLGLVQLSHVDNFHLKSSLKLLTWNKTRHKVKTIWRTSRFSLYPRLTGIPDVMHHFHPDSLELVELIITTDG